jgi:hypothetical protein
LELDSFRLVHIARYDTALSTGAVTNKLANDPTKPYV